MRNFIFFLSFLFFCNHCATSQVITDDVECLKKINTMVSNELKRELSNNYEIVIEDIKVIMEFYINESGKADSIVFIRSDLQEFNVKDNLIINSLMKERYDCLKNVYYKDKLKPDNVTVIFNPELSN